MKKVVLTFGLIAGAMISVLMDGSLLLANKIGSGHNSMVLGYTIMVASFLLIYFGIRSYRDNTLGGQISFGRAFACGILIALITTVCYVATWEVLYFNFMPHFMDSYFAAQIQKVQSSGLDPAATAAQVAAIQRSQQLYQNPLVNIAYTFIEAAAGWDYHRSCLRGRPAAQNPGRTRQGRRSRDHIDRPRASGEAGGFAQSHIWRKERAQIWGTRCRQWWLLPLFAESAKDSPIPSAFPERLKPCPFFARVAWTRYVTKHGRRSRASWAGLSCSQRLCRIRRSSVPCRWRAIGPVSGDLP